jgi:predicted nucleic acid-binding protein
VDLVVDASIVVKWLVAEDDSEAALRLRHEHDIVAPDLLLIECRNAALTRHRKGELTLEAAAQIDAELTAMYIRMLPSIPLLSAAFEIATEIKHAIYDCVYVAAAIATNRLLVTADARFAVKAATSPRLADRITTLADFTS